MLAKHLWKEELPNCNIGRNKLFNGCIDTSYTEYNLSLSLENLILRAIN